MTSEPLDLDPIPHGLLIEKFLPVFDVRDRHETLVEVDPKQAYAALRAFDLYSSRLVRWIFAIRTIPTRLRRRNGANGGGRPFLEDALGAGWRILEEEPGRELVVGAVTQPWAPIVRFQGMPGQEFHAFREPGYTKIAWNIAVRSAGPGRAILSTETRVTATDPRARRRFRVYWFFVSPGIRLIRRIALRRVRRELERVPAKARTA